MLFDRRTGKHASSSAKGHSVTRLPAMLSGLLIVGLVACAGVVTRDNLDRGSNSASATSSTGASAIAQPKISMPPKSWALKFDASFQGNRLDTGTWGTCYPWAADGCTNFGNVDDPEQEWYVLAQDQVSGGALHLVAQREPTRGRNQQGEPKEYSCRSGIVTTYPSFRFTYGFIQVTAKIPFGKGLWPAFWLAAANEQWPPEIDIFEHWHSETYGSVYLHPLTGTRLGGHVPMPALSAGWHTFSLYWTKSRVVWYYDGSQVFATSTGVPQQAMYLIANLAVDDAGPGGCTGSLLVKSVKVWQPQG